jgi:uncharacterized protein DUF3175
MTDSTKRWSSRVTRESNALDLEADVFKKKTARDVARSLSRSAERSKRKKSSPFRSAMSMLTFYMNRAGKNLPQSRKKILNDAKDELRALYGREKQDTAKRRGTAKKSRTRKAPAQRAK